MTSSTPPRLSLADVTLCCVDTRHPEQAWHAMQRCLNPIEFGRSLFFCPEGWQPATQAPHALADEVERMPTQALRSIADYNRFMLQALQPHVHTSHVLVMQWDGFVCDASRWEPGFLDWDYIGAPWYHGGSPGVVGNGGFSLRSRRLLDALAQLDHTDQEPEDMAICVTLRPRLEREFGIRFAPLEVAQRFACEYGTHRAAFGFHGMHNFAHVMAPGELRAWLDACPPEMILSRHARKLVKELMQNGRAAEALGLLRRRTSLSGLHGDGLNLMLRASLRWLRERVA